MTALDQMTLDDIIAEADRRAPGFARWVEEEQARRRAASDAFAMAEVELAGTTLRPGDWVDVTHTTRAYPSGDMVTRVAYNCRYRGRRRGQTFSGTTTVSFQFRGYGQRPKPGAWSATDKAWIEESIDRITPASPPEWLLAEVAEYEERYRARRAYTGEEVSDDR